MSNLPGLATFSRVPLGNGGQNIKGYVFQDGTKLSAIDIHGAWKLAPGGLEFSYLFGATQLPSGVKTPGNTWSGFAGGTPYNSCSGCADIAGCYTDSTKFAMIVDGAVCTTTNGGTAFTESAFPRTAIDSNGSLAKNWMGHNITYQNDNASNILFGTAGNGVFYTTDGGATSHSLSVSPGNTFLGSASPHLTAYDPTSSGNRWFYIRYGFGIYMSTTGINGTYSLMASLPAALQNVISITVDAFGTMWAVGYLDYGEVWKWTSGGGFVSVQPSGASTSTFVGVAVDPASANRIMLCESTSGTNTQYRLTRDGGMNWGAWNDTLANNPYQQTLYEQAIRYLDIPTVIGVGQQYNISSNLMQFDPLTAGRLVSFNAIDVCYCDLPASGSGGTNPLNWVGVGYGIEATVGSSILTIPGGKTLYSMWDVSTFREDSLARAVNPQLCALNPGDTFDAGLIPPAMIQPSIQAAYCVDNPLCGAIMQWGGFDPARKADPHFGTTADGFNSVQPIAASVPDTPSFAFGGGSMAAGKQGNFIVLPSYNRLGWYTKNNFATISYLPSPFNMLDTEPTPTSGWDFSGNGFWYNRFVITYHPIDELFYAMNYGNTNAINPLGVWTSPNGDVWTQVYNNTPDVNAIYNTHMKADPLAALTLYWTNGQADGNGFTGVLRRTTNGGTSWPLVTTNSGETIANVTDIGFGAPALGRANSSKYFWGQVNSVWGYYRSDDDLVTSTFLTANPANSTDYPVYIEGDLNVYGQFRFVQSGSGAMIGSYNYLLNLAS